jgi:ABC-2 type transport system ATP-binding protein
VTELSRVTKRSSPVTALEDPSFTVRPGRVTGFPGPNGAGKSTTMPITPRAGRPAFETAMVGGGELPAI